MDTAADTANTMYSYDIRYKFILLTKHFTLFFMLLPMANRVWNAMCGGP